jgi:hypothetical protein
VTLPGGDGRRRRATVTIARCALPGAGVAHLVTIHDRSDEVAREAELVRQAHRDGLTGLLNKRSFDARLAEEAERLVGLGRPLGLVAVDLDHFKAVNDEHGPSGRRPRARRGRPRPSARRPRRRARIGCPRRGAGAPGAPPPRALDGGGYPDGPAGDAIPDGARILALADAWDAMTTDRPYRRALAPDAALDGVTRLSGTQFMPHAASLLGDALSWWAAAA